MSDVRKPYPSSWIDFRQMPIGSKPRGHFPLKRCRKCGGAGEMHKNGSTTIVVHGGVETDLYEWTRHPIRGFGVRAECEYPPSG